MYSTTPADLVFARSEDVRLSIEFRDENGAPIDIASPGFGAFSLSLSSRTPAVPPIFFPGPGASLSPRGGADSHCLDLIIAKADADVLMPPGLRFTGDLVRMGAGAAPIRECWASLAVTRSAAPQSTLEQGPKSLSVIRTAAAVVTVRAAAMGMQGATGATGPQGAIGAGYAATSDTSLTVGPGPKVLTISGGLAYAAGARIRLAPAGRTDVWMEGVVTSVVSGTMGVDVSLHQGFGTFDAWNLSVAGVAGVLPQAAEAAIAALDSTVTPRSGIVFSLVDALRRYALAVRANGLISIPRLEVGQLAGTASDGEIGLPGVSGNGARPFGRWSFSLAGATRQLALGVRRDGAIFIPRLLPRQDADLTGIVAVGDSMTAGAGSSSGGYPAALAAILGRPVTNAGIGGQTSTQIAGRLGAPVRVRLAGDQIVAGANAVTELNGFAVAPMSVTPSASGQILSTPADNAARGVVGTLCGVRGLLWRSASGGPPSTAETYAFTPDLGLHRLPVHCPPGSVFLADLRGNDSRVHVIWIGRNNFAAAGATAQILADIAAHLNRLSPLSRRFVILGIANSAAESRGTSLHALVTGANAAMEAAYPDNYIDIRRVLVDAFDSGEAQDVTDNANDVPPSSLRADAAHLNDAGYAIVAQAVARFIVRKGW